MSKKDRMRECPVVGAAIDAADCGIKRGPDFGCPEGCPHNPWSAANYGRSGDTESKILRLVEKMVFDALGPVRMRRLMDDHPEEDDGGMRFNAAVIAAAYGRGQDGTSVVGRWIEANARSLKNDERVFLRCLASTRPSLFEARRVVDDRTVEVVDLLAPERGLMRMIDFRGAATARRFQTTFGFSFEMPHFLRNSGSRMPLPWISSFDPDEVVRIIARHLGWSEADEALGDWLLQNGVRVFDSIEEITRARGLRQFEQSRLEWVRIEYPPAKGRSIDGVLRAARKIPWLIEARPDAAVPDGATAFDVFAPEDAAEPELFAPDGNPAARPSDDRGRCAGKLDIGPRSVVFEGIGSDFFDRIRGELESHLAPLLGEPKVEATPLAGKAPASAGPEPDPDLVPEALLSDIGEIKLVSRPVVMAGPRPTPEEQFEDRLDGVIAMDFRSRYQRFADEPVPALGGSTPREASRDPKLRPALVRLMKEHVQRCDNERYRQRIDIDLNPLLEDLGLDELVIPAPPLPPVAEEEMERMMRPEDHDDEEDDALPDIDTLADGGLARLPAQTRLNEEEVHARVAKLHRLKSPSGFLKKLDKAWPGFLNHLVELAGPDLAREEEAFIFLYAGMIAGVLLGDRPPRRAPADFDEIDDVFDVHHAIMIRWLSDSYDPRLSEDALLELLFDRFDGHPQPELVRWVIINTINSAESSGSLDLETPVRFAAVPLVCAALLTALWEVCRVAK